MRKQSVNKIVPALAALKTLGQHANITHEINQWINTYIVELGNTTTINEPSEEYRAYAREHYTKAAIHDLAKTLVKKYSVVDNYTTYEFRHVEKITRRIWALAPQGIDNVENSIVPLIEDNS
jgi:hypothetical protein